MAFLFQNENILSGMPSGTMCQLSFQSLHNSLTSRLATVAFYPMVNGVLADYPSTNICMNTTYAMYVYIPETQQTGFLSPCSSNQLFQLLPRGSQHILMQPLTNNIVSGHMFNARFIYNGQNFNANLTITVNDCYSMVGYSSKLPSTLCNGQTGGQRTIPVLGSRTSATGQRLPVVSCPDNAVCGAIGGRCPGNCQSGYSCQQVNGIYTCVYDDSAMTLKPLWALLIGVLIIFVVIVVIGLLSREESKSNTIDITRTIYPTSAVSGL